MNNLKRYKIELPDEKLELFNNMWENAEEIVYIPKHNIVGLGVFEMTSPETKKLYGTFTVHRNRVEVVIVPLKDIKFVCIL